MTRSVSFSMLHSLVFLGIVVYFPPGGWTSARNQDAQVKLPEKSMSILAPLFA